MNMNDGIQVPSLPLSGFARDLFFHECPDPIAAAGAASSFLAWAVRGRSASVFGRSVWRGPRDRRAVALTFDDGPSESTPEILEILAGHGVPATFFQCGANVDRLPEIAREVAARGHEIGNHSYSHPYLFLRSPGAIEDELRRAQEAIEAHTGVRPGLVPRALRGALVRAGAGAAENATDRRDVERNRL